tara:strand:+ start:2719 stop:3489 length:771 start_codon:yes stop_codon:yes gene_type:complete
MKRTDTWMKDPAAYLRTLSVETVKTDDLHLNPDNANTHGADSIDAIARSIARFGFTQPLVVQKQSGLVLAGEGRLLASKQLGLSHVPVLYTTLLGNEASAFAVADNRTAQLSSWNNDVLAGLLQGASPEDQLDMGFDEASAARIIAMQAFDGDDDGEDFDLDAKIGFDDDARPEGADDDDGADPNGAALVTNFVLDHMQHTALNQAIQEARSQIRAAHDGASSEELDTSRAAAITHVAVSFLNAAADYVPEEGKKP